jgi:tetratricopeptide (TPR) repeat protein
VALEALAAAGRNAHRNARLTAGVFVLALACLASGCASLFPQTAILREGLPPGLPEVVELKEVPFFPQKEYQCGPAALATALVAAGAKVTPDELVSQVYLPGRQGSLQVEMLAAARRHGMVSYQLAPKFDDLLREVAAGNPVIVLQNLGMFDGWHYAVAVGYDYDPGMLILRSGETEREQMRFFIHEFVWRRSGYWAMVAMPPDRIPVTADETRWLAAVAALERVAGTQREHLPRARDAYMASTQRWPGNVNAHIGLANTQHALGDLRGAEAALRQAVRLEPESPVALNNLAQTLSDLGRSDEALPFIERAAATPAGSSGPFAAAIQQTRQGILERLRKKK